MKEMSPKRLRQYIKNRFKALLVNFKDPRVDRQKRHSLVEILFLCFTATATNAKGWREIEIFGKNNLEFLREFFDYSNGTPSDDTIRRLLKRLGQNQFLDFFQGWVHPLKELTKCLRLAIDGKTLRGTATSNKSATHLLSLYDVENKCVLTQYKVADKTNEIKGIPKLLNKLDSLNQTIITIDAIACQKSIVDLIVGKKGNYIISLKGNQPKLLEAVSGLFEAALQEKSKGISKIKTLDKGHGRIEERTYCVMNISKNHAIFHEWNSIKTIIKVDRTRTSKGVSSFETQYYISSCKKKVKDIAKSIRGHWAIENNLHWVLDVSFKDDNCKIHKGNAPQNMNVIKKVILNVVNKIKTKRESVKEFLQGAIYNTENIVRILSGILIN